MRQRASARRLNPIWCVLALALLLRLAGSRANLPFLYSPGESIIVRQALAYGSGSLHPYTFIYPPLYSYFLFGLYGAYFVVGRGLGIFAGLDEFAISYFSDPTAFYWMGRIATALMGVATIGLVYAIASKAYGRGEGLLAALFLTVSHLHVTHSHYVLTDVPMTFLVALAMWCLLRAASKGTSTAWVLAGGAVGVATAMKYPAALMGLVVAIGTLVWRRDSGATWRNWLRSALASLGGAILGFVVAFPYALLDFSGLWTELFGIQVELNQGIAKPFAESMWFYARTLFGTGLGPLLGAVSLLGLGALLWRRRAVDILLVAFPVIYGLFLGFQGRYQPNWLLPALPFLCIAAAAAVVLLAERFPRRGARVFLVVAAVVLVAYPAWYSAFHVKSIRQKDTRTLAKEWIEANIPPGTKMLLDSRTTGPPLSQTLASFHRYFENAEQDKVISLRSTEAQAAFDSYRRYQLEAARRKATESISYDLEYMQLAWWRAEEEQADLADFPVFGVYRERIFALDQLADAGIAYVVVSSFQYRNYMTAEAQARWPSYYAFYTSLDRQAQLVRVFHADPIHQPGPDIKVYRLGGGS